MGTGSLFPLPRSAAQPHIRGLRNSRSRSPEVVLHALVERAVQFGIGDELVGRRELLAPSPAACSTAQTACATAAYRSLGRSGGSRTSRRRIFTPRPCHLTS